MPSVIIASADVPSSIIAFAAASRASSSAFLPVVRALLLQLGLQLLDRHHRSDPCATNAAVHGRALTIPGNLTASAGCTIQQLRRAARAKALWRGAESSLAIRSQD